MLRDGPVVAAGVDNGLGRLDSAKARRVLGLGLTLLLLWGAESGTLKGSGRRLGSGAAGGCHKKCAMLVGGQVVGGGDLFPGLRSFVVRRVVRIGS